jgi:tetratricopeptide (TPR) repeat protein
MKTLVRIFLISCCSLVLKTTMARDENKFPAIGPLQQTGALPDDRSNKQQSDLPADVTLQEDVLLWLRNYVKKVGNHAMYYHLMGRGYVFHGKYPEAIRYLKQADSAFRCPIPEYLLMTKTARFWQAKQLGDIARAYRFWGFYDSAMVYHRRSLAGFLQSGMPLPDVHV